MTELEFVSYFEDVAIMLKDICHDPTNHIIRFARMEEVLNKIRSELEFVPGMVIKNEAGSIQGLGKGNLTEMHRCSFMILQQCANDDYTVYQQAFHETFVIGRKVLAKMTKDKIECVGIMLNLDLNSITWQKIGPVYDNCYGYEFHFSLTEKAGCAYTYNENDWKTP
ncbi:MAG: hypothetical protein ACPGJS_00655 [Flammeovirgaceae bacterium]